MGTFSDAVANGFLDAVARGVPFDNDEIWAKLHIGAPGAAGTANPAAETTRKRALFASAAASRALANTTALEWTNVSTTEIYTHVSYWSASAGGTLIGTDDLSAPAAVIAGDTFRIPVGDLDLTFV